jgi:hypothetical protein
MSATRTTSERLSDLGAEIQALREILDRANGDDDPTLTPVVPRVTRCTIGVADLEREIQERHDG